MCFVTVNNISDQVTVATTWFKDGIEFNINWDSRISVIPVALSGDGVFTTTLHFMPLRIEDSGYYQCTATVTAPTGYSLANVTNSTTLKVEGIIHYDVMFFEYQVMHFVIDLPQTLIQLQLLGVNNCKEWMKVVFSLVIHVCTYICIYLPGRTITAQRLKCSDTPCVARSSHYLD